MWGLRNSRWSRDLLYVNHILLTYLQDLHYHKGEFLARVSTQQPQYGHQLTFDVSSLSSPVYQNPITKNHLYPSLTLTRPRSSRHNRRHRSQRQERLNRRPRSRRPSTTLPQLLPLHSAKASSLRQSAWIRRQYARWLRRILQIPCTPRTPYR